MNNESLIVWFPNAKLSYILGLLRLKTPVCTSALPLARQALSECYGIHIFNAVFSNNIGKLWKFIIMRPRGLQVPDKGRTVSLAFMKHSLPVNPISLQMQVETRL